jgi:chemotaxis protein methyltransferase CheR
MGLSETDFDFVRRVVYDGSAIVLEPSKTYLAETRLLQIARAEGLATVSELVTLLRGCRKQALQRKVVEAMTTNETSFFRDSHPFDALKSEVLPKLVQARSDTRTLNVWSAACSTGQEAYTIAMVIREHFPELKTWNVRILATDLSRDVLDKAREGKYGQLEVNRGLPAALLVKHFRREGLHYRVSDDLKGLVEFREMNLVEDWVAVPRMDVVFLRNVLIYFNVDTKKQILKRVRDVMRPEAVLFLGGAETTINLDEAFERIPMGKASCYRVRGR